MSGSEVASKCRGCKVAPSRLARDVIKGALMECISMPTRLNFPLLCSHQLYWLQ
jgi:hypothetical protein